MHRRRLLVPILGLAAACGGAPILAGVTLGADPTVIVRPGDTVTSIAERNGVSIDSVIALNQLRDPDRIYAGQRLRVTKDDAPAVAPSAPAGAAAPAARSHTVAPGENLTHIAKRHGVTVAAVVAANGIANPSRIYAGQRLAIPGAATPAAPAAAPQPSTASPTGLPAWMAGLVAKRDEVRRIITDEAKRQEVPVALALAVAWQESGWQQGVVSHAGAIGVMQLIPATGEWVGEAMLGSAVDLRDLRHNVRAGVRLLDHYLDRYDGNIDLVLAAYYQGQTAADRHGVYPVSRQYVASIKVLIGLFGG